MATLTFTQSLHYLQQNRFFFVSYLVIIVCIRIVMVNVATAYSNGRQGGQHLRSSLLQVPVLCLIIVKKSRLLNALFHNYYCWIVRHRWMWSVCLAPWVLSWMESDHNWDLKGRTNYHLFMITFHFLTYHNLNGDSWETDSRLPLNLLIKKNISYLYPLLCCTFSLLRWSDILYVT